MLYNYLTLAVRYLKKRKLFSFINIFGLSAGVAVCLVILKYVDFELSYDRHHTNGPHIYRTILTRYLDGKLRDIIPLTGYGTGPALKVEVPWALTTSFRKRLIIVFRTPCESVPRQIDHLAP